MVRDGYFYGFGFLAAGVLVGALTHNWLWVIIPVLLALFFFWFFRDPERAIPDQAGLVVSPGDGKVTEVARIQTPEGDRIRISIFLSVFDVHVNRSPIAGKLCEVQYRKGRFLNALNPKAAQENEQNRITVQGEGFEVVFTQIAGLLARRIVFKSRVGDILQRGQRVGMIKFGSRVDVLMPGSAAVRVEPGERVKGGSSILAEMQTDRVRSMDGLLAESQA